MACFWMGVLALGSGVRGVQRLRLPGVWAAFALVVMALAVTAPLSLAIAVLGLAAPVARSALPAVRAAGWTIPEA